MVLNDLIKNYNNMNLFDKMFSIIKYTHYDLKLISSRRNKIESCEDFNLEFILLRRNNHFKKISNMYCEGKTIEEIENWYILEKLTD